ncbi:MFS transporter [Sulfurisphaera ohwakuensis]|uniref:MFS family permease n=1 Tax=Sulfurisphaera ohwakuensis TaxID=69656 RepID=A0A650CF34_SULOH|nr:MFS transporter [Sulfurisphaera ohwakuensis]MBB5254444.1 MFS family permease [Sulfurisphaera ohwakuensis]QGR16366.1 MFS transporter [Sulfurisphaera ohwakuensis]
MSKEEESKASEIIARLDRLPTWAFNYILLGIIGIGELFTFFDIFNINVSFVQTAVTLFHVSPAQAAPLLGPVVLGNLAGYVVGSLLLSPIADRIGRRDMLMITMLIMGLSSLYNAFAPNYINFLIARTLTGIGVGADLAIVNTYVSEVAPLAYRSKYVSAIFIFSTIGGFLAIWLGLLFTTPPAPFPQGLPIALGGSGFFAVNGWRVMYIIGAALALVGLALRFRLPESPRWLVSKGRISEAEMIVNLMEEKVTSKGYKLPSLPSFIPVYKISKTVPYSEILTNSSYLKRFVLLVVVWFLAYTTVYSIAAGLTSLLTAQGYSPSEAGMVSAIGIIGFVLAAVIATLLGERLERKWWIGIGALVTVIGGMMIALTPNPIIDGLGAIILFIGFNVWVPVAYTWTAESFPTRARTSGFALCDGIGHLGGGLGVVYITSVAVSLHSTVELFGLIALFLVISAIIAMVAGHYTLGKRLDEISP